MGKLAILQCLIFLICFQCLLSPLVLYHHQKATSVKDLEGVQLTTNNSTASYIKQRFQIIRRGGGLLTTHSPCRISRWIYTNEEGTERLFRECCPPPTNKELDDTYCRLDKRQQQLPMNEQLTNATHLSENDTIFVPFTALPQFVNEILYKITTNIIIISGQTHIVDSVPNEIISKLLSSKHVIQWFCMNSSIYGGDNPTHPKISPFPYGLKEKERHGWFTFDTYKDILFNSLKGQTNKTEMIFAGPLGNTQLDRASFPQTKESLQPDQFFQRMLSAKYILSPNGDRPECHRHYEAIGLGTAPITQLDPILFRHLGSSVIYDNLNWNLTLLEEELDPNIRVNRNLIREDYWMSWCDNVVGKRLNWNILQGRSGLSETQENALSMISSI